MWKRLDADLIVNRCCFWYKGKPKQAKVSQLVTAAYNGVLLDYEDKYHIGLVVSIYGSWQGELSLNLVYLTPFGLQEIAPSITQTSSGVLQYYSSPSGQAGLFWPRRTLVTLTYVSRILQQKNPPKGSGIADKAFRKSESKATILTG